jgi:CheY-like chemotaxis protein
MSETTTSETVPAAQNTPRSATPGAGYVPKNSISGVTGHVTRRLPSPPLSILVADDDAVSRIVMERTLKGWGYSVGTAQDGTEAWNRLRAEDPPAIAVLDWVMPGLEGPELCRRVRALGRPVPTYLILLTAKVNVDDVVVGLESGADDYVTKPFDRAELRSRLRVGERVVSLQQGLADRVLELETALSQVKQLKGLLPICGYCKKIRDDHNYWQKVETYVAAHSDARFTHGICPTCWTSVVEPQLAEDRIAQGATG